MSIQFIAQVVRDALRNQQIHNALAAVQGLPPIDLADVLSLLKPDHAWFILQNIPQRADVFAYFVAERQILMEPASANAPLITSICDASGVVIYLYIATQLLHLTV